eukprot:g36496.t1
MDLANTDTTDATRYCTRPKLDSAATSLLWAHLANAAAAAGSHTAPKFTSTSTNLLLDAEAAGNPNPPLNLPPGLCCCAYSLLRMDAVATTEFFPRDPLVYFLVRPLNREATCLVTN